MPDEAEGAIDLLKGCMGSQVEKLESLPIALDEIVALIGTDHGGTVESPKVITKTITLELPDGWERKMNREIQKLNRNYSNDKSYGCGSIIGFVLLFIFLIVVIF